MQEAQLEERTVGGLHDFLEDAVFPHYVRPGQRVVDLGCGSGALAIRLDKLGLDVVGCDLDDAHYRAPSPFLRLDLNEPGFATRVGQFDLVTAVEVIEHLESPIGFLRAVRELLKDDGVAMLTTPNVDSLPARGKLLTKGAVRMFDTHGDPTHISPIFWDLLVRQYLPTARLRLVEHRLYPQGGFQAGRPLYKSGLRLLAPVLGRGNLLGDNHVLVLQR